MTETVQILELGYRTPDGVEHWVDQAPIDQLVGEADLRTQEGQDAVRRSFRDLLTRSHLPETDFELEFIQRVRTISYSAVIPLIADTLTDPETPIKTKPRRDR